MKNYKNSQHLQRAVWPEVVFASDIALVLDLDPDEAVRILRAGGFGPYLEVHGRPAVLRRDLLEALSRRAESPAPWKEISQAGERGQS